MFESGPEVLAYLLLLTAIVGMAYYAMTLRRLDDLDAGADDTPVATTPSDDR